MPSEDGCPFLEINDESISWHFEQCTPAPGCPQSNWYSNNLYLYPQCLRQQTNRTEDITTEQRSTSSSPVYRINTDTDGTNKGSTIYTVLFGGLLFLVIGIVFILAMMFEKRKYDRNSLKLKVLFSHQPVIIFPSSGQENVTDIDEETYAENILGQYVEVN